MTLIVPQSMLSYFQETVIETGVEAILARPDKLPADLKWEEMPAYYKAYLAAQRVMVDHAILMDELWRASWAGCIAANWQTFEPDDQVPEDPTTDPHPRWAWTNDWHTRIYERGQRRIYLCVSIEKEGAYIGFGVFKIRTWGNAIPSRVDGFELNDEGFHWQEKPFSYDSSGQIAFGTLSKLQGTALKSITKAIGQG